MKETKIEWSDSTWNAVSGCDKVSPGCDHCYADAIATRFAGGPAPQTMPFGSEPTTAAFT